MKKLGCQTEAYESFIKILVEKPCLDKHLGSNLAPVCEFTREA